MARLATLILVVLASLAVRAPGQAVPPVPASASDKRPAGAVLAAAIESRGRPNEQATAGVIESLAAASADAKAHAQPRAPEHAPADANGAKKKALVPVPGGRHAQRAQRAQRGTHRAHLRAGRRRRPRPTPAQVREMQRAFMVLFLTMVVSQAALFFWKERHRASYVAVTLFWMWAVPPCMCLRFGWYVAPDTRPDRT